MAQPPSQQAEFDIDFSQELPPWDFFPFWWLKKSWKCSLTHLFNLAESGELPVAVDLRNRGSSRAMIRAPRKSVVEFLNRRKNLAAIADASPQPKARKRARR